MAPTLTLTLTPYIYTNPRYKYYLKLPGKCIMGFEKQLAK